MKNLPLSNLLLLQTYAKAKRLKLDTYFLQTLRDEMKSRKLIILLTNTREHKSFIKIPFE